MTSFTRIRGMALTCVSGVALNCALGGVAFAQSADAPARSPNEIVVTGAAASESDPSFIAKKVHLPTVAQIKRQLTDSQIGKYVKDEVKRAKADGDDADDGPPGE